MTFRVGQKVVCVDTAGLRRTREPKLGAIYTIRGMFYQDGETGILLEEITNPMHLCGGEDGYRSRRFRPIVERKTDISIFTEMLTDTRVPA